MSYADIASDARGQMGPVCKACPICNGRACASSIPGPGSYGSGLGSSRNFDAWQGVTVNMDTLHEPFEPDTTFDFYGHSLSSPIMIAPVGDIEHHYGSKYTMDQYNELITSAAASCNTLAWLGDGVDPSIYAHACSCIGQVKGAGVATCKPWSEDICGEKVALAQEAGVSALAMDVDAAGLPFLQGLVPAAGPKSVDALSRIVELCGIPFIAKGIMTPGAAQKCAAAGCAGIVVSNHGGRVLDGVPPTAYALADIVAAIPDTMKVFVDGGIRTGLDVFRALAIGAHGVLICRPFVVAAYGRGEAGVVEYYNQLVSELRDTMLMCGARRLSDIDGSMIYEMA